MANRLGRMTIQEEMAAGDGEVGSDGQFLSGTRTKQRAVVADAEADAGGLHGPAANLAEKGQLA